MPPSLRSLTWSVFLPTLLYGIGQGAIAPVIVTSAVELHASLTVAGLLAAAVGIGQIAGDLPSGVLIARIGEKRAMLLAVALVAPALFACITARTLWVLGAGVFAAGLGGAMWGLARQTYITDVVPFELRARALSTLAGVNRIGRFLGPFAGAATMGALGPDGAYWIHLVAALLAAGVVASVSDVVTPADIAAPVAGNRHPTTGEAMRQHLSILRTLGLAVASMGALRATRQTVIPLWGVHIGLSATAISVIFGLSAGLDMLLFYPGGQIMDRLGRRWVAVPSNVILGLSHALLPLTHGAVGLALVGMLMGLGNGISSGIIMTLGADLAPATGRHQFLGAWRLVADIGNGAGPLALTGLIAVFSPAAAVVVVGGLGLATAWGMKRWIPHTVA